MAEDPRPLESVDAHGCPVKRAEAPSPPLFQNGVLTFQAHHVGWIMSGFFTLSAIGLSIWLIGKHLQWYTNKRTQRQIIRLLLMVPLYAIISSLAYLFWDYALPLTLIRDAYEGVILAAFFYLLLNYLAPTQAEQKEYFRHYTLKRWCWPFGWVKSKPDGLYFLQMMKWGILQYCWIRPLTTLGAIILDKVGYYCESSWSPKFGSVWVLIIVSVSVTIAMYCLIQLYLAISDRIKHHRPVLQLFSVKAIIFLMFWQSTFLSVLHSLNVVKDTKYMTAEEINIGFAALLQTFEMMLFAFLHLYCFSYKPYRKTDPNLQTPRWKSLSHALDFRDYWRETADGSVYMWRIARGKEAEIEARRLTHLEKAMGRGRSQLSASNNPLAAGAGAGHRREGRALLDDDLEELWDFDATSPTERQVLNVKLDNGRPFSAKIDDARVPHRGGGDAELGHVREKGSWWRRMYHQLSTHDREEGPSRDVEKVQAKVQQWQASVLSPINLVGGKAKGKSKSTSNRPEERGQIDLDSPPPPSFLAKPRLVTKVETRVEGLPSQSQSQSRPTPLPPVIPADENGRVLSPPPVPVKENSNNELPSSLERGLPPPPLSPSVDLRSVDSVLARMFAGPMEYSSSEEEEPQNTHTVGSPKDKGKGRAAQRMPMGITEDVQVSPDSPQATTPTPLPHSGSSPRRGVAPFQPTPIPHASLSNASRPEVLRLSDEQIERKVAAIPARLVHAVEPALYPGLRNQTSQPTRKERIHDARPHEVKERDRDITPKFASGPRRPPKIVLPTPLSPARYPEGGVWSAAGGSGFRSSAVDPREFGIDILPQSHSQPSSQSQTSIQARWPSTRNSRHWKHELEPPRSSNRMPPSHTGPPPPIPRVLPEFVPPRFVGASPPMKQLRSAYEPLPPGAGSAPGSPQGFNDTYRHTTSHPPRPQVRAHHDSAYRDVPSKYGYPAPGSSRRQHNGQQHYSPDSRPSKASNLPNSGRHRPPDIPARSSNYRNRSHSPFGIDTLESDLESLPRHPAVRPQVARMRRESFPNPRVSDGRSSRRISEPQQPLSTSRVASPTSPIASSPSLLSPLNDSRYPIAGSRPTYFDKFDSSEFLTTLTTLTTQSPPILPGNDNPYPDVLPPILSTPGKKHKRK